MSFKIRIRAGSKRRDPVQLVVWGYATYILVGWLFLCLPICNEREEASVLDHLFTATSAVSTTGLTTVSTADTYSRTGEVVVALLIQFGGLGYMTIGSFVIIAVSRRTSMVRDSVSQVALSSPTGIPIRRFIVSIVLLTVAIEIVGAGALYQRLQARDVPDAAWSAAFHSISAFCTAGFSLFNDSLVGFRSDVGLNVIIIVLSYLGAIGFIVMNDVVERIRKRKRRLSLSSRVILWCTFYLSMAGTVLLAIDESTLTALPAGERIMAALFQAMTASTTVGFNTVDIASLSGGSVFLITMIMIVGASPSGTGGGIKTTTVTALWANMVSLFRGLERTNFGDRELPTDRVRLAMASSLFYLTILCIGIYALSLVDKSPLPDQMFECASAIGTVGLSRGITSGLTWMGKIIIIILMFAGRVGPLALAMTLMRRDLRPPMIYYPKEDIAI